MSGKSFIRRNPADRQTAAAQWALQHISRTENDPTDAEFTEWLDRDPANAAAYFSALEALDAVARNAGEPEVLALRHAALAARGSGRGRLAIAGGGAMAAAAAAAALLFALAPGTPLAPVAPPASQQLAQRKAAQSGVFRTGIGERAAIDLPDGSIVTLDTDSEIRIAYSHKARAIYLVSGQALFDVAHGWPQPFQVFAKGQRITAVGTVFNVRIEGPAVRISMVEGIVRLRREARMQGPLGPTELTLTAGEAALASPDNAPTIERSANVRSMTSWKGGVLVFNDTPLLDAVAEINRYTTQPIAIADAGVAAYRVNGVFKTSDPEHFAQAMAEVLPIEIVRAPDGAATLRARKD